MIGVDLTTEIGQLPCDIFFDCITILSFNSKAVAILDVEIHHVSTDLYRMSFENAHNVDRL